MISGLTSAYSGQYYTRTAKTPGAAKPRSTGKFQEAVSAQSGKEPVKQAVCAKSADAATLPRRKATTEEIAELAEKYDSTNMSQKEYAAFLDDLVSRGLVREDELEKLGYFGYVPCGVATGKAEIVVYDVPDISAIRGGIPCRYDPMSGRPDDGLWQFRGNAFAWTKIMALWKPSSGTSQACFDLAMNMSESFTAVSGILESIQSYRRY